MKVKSVSAPAMLEGLEYLPLSLSKAEWDFDLLTRYVTNFADANGLMLATVDLPDDDRWFTLVHLPEARKCPSCSQVDVHVFICLLCGEWVCAECGTTIPVSATVH